MSIRKITIDDVSSIGEIYVKAFNHHPDSIKLYKLEPYVHFCIEEGYAFVRDKAMPKN